MEHRLFISYAHDDGKEAATRVRQLLGRAMGSAWRDEDNLVGGREFSNDIQQALTSADAVVLIATPRAATSDWVQKEVRFARTLKKRVIPLKYISGDFPAEWLDLQIINFQADRPDQDLAVAELVAAINAIWDDVHRDVDAARDKYYGDRLFAPVLDRLAQTMRTSPRPPYGPELPRLCVYIIERLDGIRKQRTETDAADEFAQGRIVLSDSTWTAAHATHKRWVDNIFEGFLAQIPRPPVKVVRFVLAVMTAAEAAELATRKAYGQDDTVLREHFEQNVLPLLTRDVPDWQERYGERPELWRPYGPNTLSELFQGWFNEHARDYRTPERIQAQFIDIRTLIDDSRRVLKELRREGCELVADAVSLCHPRIFGEYRRSALDVLPTTRVARVASLEMPVFKQALRIPIQQHIDSYFYERRSDGDPSCDRAGSEEDLHHWASEIAKDVSPPPAGNSRSYYRERS